MYGCVREDMHAMLARTSTDDVLMIPVLSLRLQSRASLEERGWRKAIRLGGMDVIISLC